MKQEIIDSKVISYRVREYDSSSYIVEEYSMKYKDEMSFFIKRNMNYSIKYNTRLTRKKKFYNEIKMKFNINEHHNNIDDFNFYLATNYYTTNKKLDLTRLNELASSFNSEYNKSILSEKDSNEVRIISKYPNIDILKIECINVGQANFSIGYNKDNKPIAVFDIGIRAQVFTNREYAQNKIKEIDGEGVVVISHYDTDHINGYRYLTDKILNRQWILPQKRLNPTQTERNLLYSLNPSKCNFLKNINYKKTPFDYSKHVLKIGNLSIFQGNEEKIDIYQSTDENARCLICLITKEKSILIPADSLYEEFPTNFNINYLIVPHHCCFYDKKIKQIDLNKLEELVVYAGPHSGYKHPNLSHLNCLGRVTSRNIFTHYLMNRNKNYYFDNKQIVNTTLKIEPISCTIDLI